MTRSQTFSAIHDLSWTHKQPVNRTPPELELNDSRRWQDVMQDLWLENQFTTSRPSNVRTCLVVIRKLLYTTVTAQSTCLTTSYAG